LFGAMLGDLMMGTGGRYLGGFFYFGNGFYSLFQIFLLMFSRNYKNNN
jgi:hypothetical protein